LFNCCLYSNRSVSCAAGTGGQDGSRGGGGGAMGGFGALGDLFGDAGEW